MGILLGALAALLFGSSDVLAARASRTAPVISVTRTALLVSLVFTPFFLLFKSFHLTGLDWLYGVLSGVATGLALLVLYIGYQRASIAVVAPVAAVLSAVVPVLVGLGRGNGLTLVAGAGIVVGVVAVGLSTYQPPAPAAATTLSSAAAAPDGLLAVEPSAKPAVLGKQLGLVIGIIAGVGFGLAFAFLSLTNKHAGLAPVPIQRAVGLLFLTLVHPVQRARWVVTARGRSRIFATCTGLTAGIAMGTLQLAYRHGSTAPVSVAASQFAAATVLISALVNHERLRRTQALGLVFASLGVALMALG